MEQARNLLAKSETRNSRQSMDVDGTEQRILQTNEDALLLIEKIERELRV